MAKRLLISIIAGSVIAFMTQTVLADDDHDMPNGVVQISTIIQNIQAKGYHNIQEVEFDDGVYKAEAMNSEGKEVKLYIDSQKNEIIKVKTGWKIKTKNTSSKLSILDAIKKVEAAGYHDIYEIDFEHGKYEVKALDKDGKKTELRVNANTGDMS